MRKLILPLLAACLVLPNSVFAVKTLTTSNARSYEAGGVSVSLSDPAGSIYRPGESIQFSYQTSEDAYVIVFDIDTEGYVHLIHPINGRLAERSAAGQRYSIPDPREVSSLVVEGETGIEFIFALSVPWREYVDENELYFLADDRPFQIDGDPFLAANMIAGELIRGISNREDVSLAYTYFHINNHVDYPRYICAECHEKTTRPYYETCTEYDFAANFTGGSANLGYPLARAYEISAKEYSDEDIYEDDVDVTRIEVIFYPYDSYVDYYRPWWIHRIYYDPWWYYDPFWYDPWYACAGYYPFHPWHHHRYGFWFSFGWNWGWSDGIWAGYHYPYYRHGYPPYRWIRPHRPGGYRYKGPSLTNTLQVASQRDPDLRISSLKYKGASNIRLNKGTMGKDSAYRVKDRSTQTPFKPPSSKLKDGTSRIKSPPVKRDKPHIIKGREGGIKDRDLKKPATKPKQPQTPKSKLSTPKKPATKGIDNGKSKDSNPSKSKKPRSYVPNSRRTPEKKPGAVKPSGGKSKKGSSSVKPSPPSRSSSSKSSSGSSYKPPSRSSSPKSSPSRSGSSGGKSKSGSSKGGKGKK